jgi:predicted HicB family RNase H-like nuclease
VLYSTPKIAPISFTVAGNNEEKVYLKLCQIVDEWIEIYSQDGRPLPPPTAGKKYSGKFQLRLGTELHQALAIRAMQSGDSLNNCNYSVYFTIFLLVIRKIQVICH